MFEAHELTHTLEIEVEGTPEEFWSFLNLLSSMTFLKQQEACQQ